MPVDDAALLQGIHHGFQQGGSQNAQQEVKAVDGGPHTRQQIAEGEHQQIGQHVCHHDQRDLHSELVD